MLSQDLLVNSFCSQDEIILNFSQKLNFPKSLSVGKFNVLPFIENETNSFSELSFESTKFVKTMFLFQPLNDLLLLNNQCFNNDNSLLFEIVNFINQFTQEINIACRNVTVLRKQFNMSLSQINNSNLYFEIISLNEIDEDSKNCAITAFRCIPYLLQPPSKSDVGKFEPLLNIFNLV